MSPEELVSGIRNNWLLFVLGIPVMVISYLLTLSSGVRALGTALEKTLWQKRALAKRLIQLSTDVNVAYFEALLGTPTFINRKDEDAEVPPVVRTLHDGPKARKEEWF